MSGKPSGPTSLFVVVWEDNLVVRVYDWHDWLAIPPNERPFDSTMLRAKDELDAMLRAERGEEWHTQQSKWMEQEDDAK